MSDKLFPALLRNLGLLGFWTFIVTKAEITISLWVVCQQWVTRCVFVCWVEGKMKRNQSNRQPLIREEGERDGVEDPALIIWTRHDIRVSSSTHRQARFYFYLILDWARNFHNDEHLLFFKTWNYSDTLLRSDAHTKCVLSSLVRQIISLQGHFYHQCKCTHKKYEDLLDVLDVLLAFQVPRWMTWATEPAIPLGVAS